MTNLDFLIFSAKGLALANRLFDELGQNPWRKLPPGGGVELYAPCALLQRNCGTLARPYARLNDLLAKIWPEAAGLVFIGATGIAVRSIAPFLRHKSCDPPVLVIDAGGKFVISLLSGHWGGGNSLAAHLAGLLRAQPVITTASDRSGLFALDLAAQAKGLRIVDWDKLPYFQALLLEGQSLPVLDPWRQLCDCPALRRKPLCQLPQGKTAISVHWRKMPAAANLLRLALPILHLGIGCRRGIAASELEQGLEMVLTAFRLERLALAAIATIKDKLSEEALQVLRRNYQLPLVAFTAKELAAEITPNPAVACGRHFGTEPFSVCEAAAMLSAKACGNRAFLLVAKQKIRRSMTFAVALALPEKSQCLRRSL